MHPPFSLQARASATCPGPTFASCPRAPLNRVSRQAHSRTLPVRGSATDAPAGLPPLPQSDPRRRSGSQRWARGQTLARSAACSALGLRWLKLWGGVSEFLDEHAGVLAVVDRYRHHMHPARGERLLQGRDQVLRGVHPPAPRAIALRVLDEVGIAEGQAEVGEAVHGLLP